jgi:catechol 2,3-dioxygenase-like lactoylglutathione lyase family enzyme
MAIQFNHTIVWSSNQSASAKFLAEMLGRPMPTRFGHFDVVELDNGVSLDFADAEGAIRPQHYAFLISEAEFDAVLGRIKDRGLGYWADPRGSRPGEINHNDGGRGVYFRDPDSHYLEVITRPYGIPLTEVLRTCFAHGEFVSPWHLRDRQPARRRVRLRGASDEKCLRWVLLSMTRTGHCTSSDSSLNWSASSACEPRRHSAPCRPT